MVGFKADGTNGKREVNGKGNDSQMRKIRWREVGREPGWDGARAAEMGKASGDVRRHWRMKRQRGHCRLAGVNGCRVRTTRERGSEGELTHFFSRVFFRMKVMSFFSSRMQTRSPMTPPTTARMMRVTVLSTSSTGGGGQNTRYKTGHPAFQTMTLSGQQRPKRQWYLFLSPLPTPLPIDSYTHWGINQSETHSP